VAEAAAATPAAGLAHISRVGLLAANNQLSLLTTVIAYPPDINEYLIQDVVH
jgi:hypothetical protein